MFLKLTLTASFVCIEHVMCRTHAVVGSGRRDNITRVRDAQVRARFPVSRAQIPT